jgi:hypothetical protein
MINDYDQLITGNNTYNDNKDRWLFLYRSFVGGREYREAGYLTRYQLESDSEYIARCNETPLDNQCRSIISVYTSFLFRTLAIRDYGSLTNLPELEDFLKDADLEGRRFDNFMKEASTWSQVFGHCWVIMSKPNVGAITRADELEQGIRPYLSILTPLVVLDWEWARSANGKYSLTYFKYVEDINDSIQVIKEWDLETVTTYTVDNENEEIIETTQEANELGIIPVVISYNDRSIVRGVGVSSISDIADLQRYIYNSLSEAAQSIRLDSHPSLVATPETQIGTGAGSIIRIPENMDGNLKPYVLDFAGASIDSIYKVITETITTIEKQANIGTIRSTETVQMSGVSREMEFQLLNARLATMADNLELTEEGIWRLFCLYQGQPYDVYIDYPSNFSIRDTTNELDELKKAKDITTDPVLLAEIDQKIADILGVEAYTPVIQTATTFDQEINDGEQVTI